MTGVQTCALPIFCYSQTQIKPKSLNPNQISNQHFQTSIEEKPSGERDPWLHEDRSEEEEKDFEERRREHSGEERESFRKNEEK